VVFDVGNVLINAGFKDIFKVYPLPEETQTLLYSRMFNSPYWTMMDHGTLSLDDAITAMTGRHTEFREHVDYLVRHWMEYKTELPEGIRALKACKRHGKRLLVLSNYPAYAFAALRQRLSFFALFDGMVISSEEGHLKPNPALFRIAEMRYGLIPERTLFIDDSNLNVETALSLSWQAVCARVCFQMHSC
jgi:2-haloacid dehalogenase